MLLAWHYTDQDYMLEKFGLQQYIDQYSLVLTRERQCRSISFSFLHQLLMISNLNYSIRILFYRRFFNRCIFCLNLEKKSTMFYRVPLENRIIHLQSRLSNLVKVIQEYHVRCFYILCNQQYHHTQTIYIDQLFSKQLSIYPMNQDLPEQQCYQFLHNNRRTVFWVYILPFVLLAIEFLYLQFLLVRLQFNIPIFSLKCKSRRKRWQEHLHIDTDLMKKSLLNCILPLSNSILIHQNCLPSFEFYQVLVVRGKNFYINFISPPKNHFLLHKSLKQF